MAKKPLKGNYVVLDDVRVYYNEKDDSITLSSKDKDFEEYSKFFLTLHGNSDTEMTLRKLLMKAGITKEIKKLPLVQTVPEDNAYPDHIIPLGESFENEVIWDTKHHPNLLLTGTAGAGKSTMLNSILEQFNNRASVWDFYTFGLMDSELLGWEHNTVAQESFETKDEVQTFLEDTLNYANNDKTPEIFPDGAKRRVVFISNSRLVSLHNQRDPQNVKIMKLLTELYTMSEKTGLHFLTASYSSMYLPLPLIFLSGVRIHLGQGNPADLDRIFSNAKGKSVSSQRGEGYYYYEHGSQGRFMAYIPGHLYRELQHEVLPADQEN